MTRLYLMVSLLFAVMGLVEFSEEPGPMWLIGAGLMLAMASSLSWPSSKVDAMEEWMARCEDCDDFLESAPSIWQALAKARNHEEQTGHQVLEPEPH